MAPLAKALQRLAAEAHGEALEGLLTVWEETRSPALAAFIEQVSERLEPTLPPVDLASHASVAGAIKARLARSGPLDVGPLITAIQRAMRTAPGAYGLLVALAKRHPADPRVATALHALVLDPPFARSEGALYGNVVQALERSGDPRYLPQIVAWSERLEARRRYIRKERADLDVLRECAVRVRKRAPPQEPGWIVTALAAHTAGAPMQRGATSRRDEAALLAAVYQRPDDVSARLVYADALSERGDLRGEFITLQCNRAPDTRPSTRERELLRNYGRAWLGALDSGIRKQGLVYRRGFLAEARECGNDEQLCDPAWATIEALELGDRTWGDRAVRFADREDLRALERLYLRCDDAAGLTRPRPRLRVLGLRSISLETLAEVARKDCFPALEVLELDWGAGNPRPAFTAAMRLVSRVKVRFTTHNLRELHQLAGLVPSVEVVDGLGLSDDGSGWSLRFSGERLEHVHFSCGDGRPDGRFARFALRTLTRGALTAATADPSLDVHALFGEELDRLGVKVERGQAPPA